jgi:hypothetical protein
LSQGKPEAPLIIELSLKYRVGAQRRITKERASREGRSKDTQGRRAPKGGTARACSPELELKVDVAVIRGMIQTCVAIGDYSCSVLASILKVILFF